MVRYIIRRLLQSLLIIWGVSVIVFAISRLGGNPVDLMLPLDAPQATRDRLVQQMGLDQPIYIQYLRFISNAARGDFGDSLRYRQPALNLVLDRVPATLQLTAVALTFAIVVGIPLGILAAIHHRGVGDFAVTSFVSLGQAVPSFWLGIMLMLFFGLRLGWFPISGREEALSVVLPALTLSIVPLVTITRLTRSSMLEVLPQDYVRTARAKGLHERSVVRHALRNALIPVVTVIGLQLGALLSGAVITEQIFAWPGIGLLAINSINARDFPVIQAVVLFGSIAVVLLNLIIDLSYALIDPRIRYGR
jgi:peptide/nickel transport system permease protein